MADDVRYRDAMTGEYVTEAYAEEHPDTTVAETDNDDWADDEEVNADGG